MSRLLQENMNMTILQPGELTYGVFDFHADHSVLVSVIMLDAYGDPVTAVENLPVLPKDEMRLRGTFKGMNRVLSARKVYNPGEDGGVYFMLADNKSDKYRKGIDATDGSAVTNYGNYGILYKIDIPTKGKTHTRYYLEPLGGVYAGAMTVRRGKNSKADLILTPDWTVYFGEADGSGRDRELACLGSYDNKVKSHFEFSPPGASNLPVHIIMVPEK
jgi:hypothetical protein